LSSDPITKFLDSILKNNPWDKLFKIICKGVESISGVIIGSIFQLEYLYYNYCEEGNTHAKKPSRYAKNNHRNFNIVLDFD
jgi:hypothetical protein